MLRIDWLIRWLVMVLISTLSWSVALAIPRADFLPFGTAVGDERLPANDDGSSGEIVLETPFRFFGTSQSSLWVNNNGNITFDGPLPIFTPFAFPGSRQIVAPYFADVDTTGSQDVADDDLNDVYFSIRTRRADLVAIASLINQAFGNGFTPTTAFVATWDHVGYFSAHTDLLNTFQVVVATDGTESFVIFNYLDDGMSWETGDASGGSGGFGGTQALAGFDAGNGVDFFAIPGSRAAGIAEVLETGSNIGIPGQWVFQVTEDIAPPAMLTGDINGNGMLDADDAQLLLEVLVGLGAPEVVGRAVELGDINADGRVTNRDSIIILAVATGDVAPPPDNRLITVTDNDDGTFTVVGGPNTVPAAAQVQLTNTQGGAGVTVTAAANGSFQAVLEASAGDMIVIAANDSPARTGLLLQ